MLIHLHPWPPVALQAKAMLFADVGQYHHISALALAHWAGAPCTKSPRCDLHDTAQKLNDPDFLSDIDKDKPHRLWPAKKPLGTLLRNALSGSGCFCTHLFSVERTTPRTLVMNEGRPGGQVNTHLFFD